MVNTFCPKIMAGAEFDNDDWVVFRHRERLSLVLHYSPELDGSAPNWVYALCAVFFWIYQTMDGMDGKQA